MPDASVSEGNEDIGVDVLTVVLGVESDIGDGRGMLVVTMVIGVGVGPSVALDESSTVAFGEGSESAVESTD